MRLPKNAKTAHSAKSSPEARRLIRAALRRGKTLREAARLLGLPNHAQMAAMLSGRLRDTPAMRAELMRAKQRADRAWRLVKVDATEAIDRAAVCAIVARLERDLALLREMCR